MSTTTTLSADTTTHGALRRRVGAVLAIVLVAIALAGCETRSAGVPIMPSDARTFLDRTNSLRRSVGVASLTENGTLTEKAEAWAQHMAATGRLEHSTLSAGLGGLSWTLLAENVGYSSPTSDTLLTIHNNFVASAPHRANLVDGRLTHMGVGVAKDGAGRVWVAEVFARL